MNEIAQAGVIFIIVFVLLWSITTLAQAGNTSFIRDRYARTNYLAKDLEETFPNGFPPIRTDGSDADIIDTQNAYTVPYQRNVFHNRPNIMSKLPNVLTSRLTGEPSSVMDLL